MVHKNSSGLIFRLSNRMCKIIWIVTSLYNRVTYIHMFKLYPTYNITICFFKAIKININFIVWHYISIWIVLTLVFFIVSGNIYTCKWISQIIIQIFTLFILLENTYQLITCTTKYNNCQNSYNYPQLFTKYIIFFLFCYLFLYVINIIRWYYL